MPFFTQSGGLQGILMSIVPILLCLTLHEMAHGYAAYLLGDDTAKRAGRLTLNPFAHLDPIGTIMLLLCGFGYAKPVPVNMYRMKNPKIGMAITAAAGPLMNILISAVCLFAFGCCAAKNPYGLPCQLLERTATLSAGLAVFNLIPIPPLDGSKVLFSFLPQGAYEKAIAGSQICGILLMVLVMFNILSPYLVTAQSFVLNYLDFLANLGYTMMR